MGLAAACVIFPLEILGLAANSGWVIQSLLLLAVGVILALVILWSLIPKRDKSPQPGVEISLEAHPRLCELIQEVTSLLGEQMPNKVYLSGEANASVAERGGLFGMGSRRVMTLGLPLIAVMSTAELRGVIAHECAHFYTGDTWLAPRVYSARLAMARIIFHLTEESALTDALNRFGFGKVLYLLVTILLTQYWRVFSLFERYVSRLQEYRSDEIAAFVAGSYAVMSGLSNINRAQMIVDTFWAHVIYPVLEGGFLPPLALSFQELASSPAIQTATEGIYSALLQNSKVDRNSTHPPLRLRLERLERLCGETTHEREPALGLLNYPEGLERDLLALMFKEIKVFELTAADWDAIGPNVHLRAWRIQVREHLGLLASYTVASVPDLLTDLSVLAGSIRDPEGRLLTREQRAEQARQLIWKSLALKLVDKGWRLEARPGTLHLVKEDQRITPADLLQLLTRQTVDSEWWSAFCESNGLSGESLASL